MGYAPCSVVFGPSRRATIIGKSNWFAGAVCIKDEESPGKSYGRSGWNDARADIYDPEIPTCRSVLGLIPSRFSALLLEQLEQLAHRKSRELK
jgi:hypothetical protein